MNSKTTLIGIGYWHNSFEPHLPDPGNFVDEEWNEDERLRVLEYLKSGLRMPYTFGGVSWCRFRCGVQHLGALEFTDGKYLWPEGLAHYIEKHLVRLPHEPVQFMLSNSTISPVEDNFEIDWSWWLNQKGFATIIKTFNSELDIGILTITQINTIQKLKQGDMLRKYLLDQYGVKGRLHSIDKIISGEKTEIKGRFKDINNFLAQLPAIGLNGEFRHEATKDLWPDDCY